MKNPLKFFLEVSKLKTTQRTGWILREVENPETIAEHTFRVAIAAWILGREEGLKIERIIKTALSHDLCEVYAGDVTPFFYYTDLPKDKAKRKKKLMKWVRLSKKDKTKKGRKKLKLEEKSLLKLLKSLEPETKKEIYSHWLDFVKRLSEEGKFVKQIDKIETLIQAIEYFGTGEDTPASGWWEEAEEMVEKPLLLNFLKVVQKKLYGHVNTKNKGKKGLEDILDFILEIGKLKRIPRKLWVSLGVKTPETVASHIFSVALMGWIFGKERRKLNMEKLLKMALCHEIPSIYTGDLITPYSRVLPKTKEERRKVFEKWPRLSKKEKEAKFLKDFKKEKKALQKLTHNLPNVLKKEIVQLFEEYKTASSPEARFLNQLNVLAVLLQGLEYQKEDKELPIDFLWEWAFEKSDDPMCLSFMEKLKDKFYGKRFIYRVLRFINRKKKK